MPQPSFSNIVHVSIDGRVLAREEAQHLVEGWVDQGMGVPAAFQLTFRDPKRKLLGLLGVEFGTPVQIFPVAAGRGTTEPLLTGEVTGLEADFDGTGSFAVIRGYDSGFRLMRQRRVVAYRNQRASDIARKLAGLDGVPVGRIDATETVYEFISQGGVSDWDFLGRLADENEMVMSIDARGRFQFVNPRPASGAPSPQTDSQTTPFVLGRADILRLRAAVTAADQVSEVESRGWDVAGKRRIIGTSPAATDPGIDIGSSPGAATARFKPVTLVETGTPYDRQAEVKHAAAALAGDVTSSFAEVEVIARGTPKLRAGIPVALAEVGKPFEGKYTVTSVRHVFGDGEHYQAWVTVSGRQWRSLYGLASGGGGGTQAEGRLPSVANALVTDVRDPLKQGRVKLEFPWLDDQYVSDWARVVQWGGKGGGGIFPLDVGDEVLVAFDRGALDHPFVIGGLYNGKDTPTAVPDVPLHDGLRRLAARHTLSDRTGNRLDLLSQQTGARKRGVRLATGDDRLVINLDRTKTEITVDSEGAVSISGSRSVSVEAGTDLTLSARRKLTLRSGGILSIEGRGPVNVRSLTGPVAVNAAAAVSVRAMAAVDLTAAGVMSLKAATMPLVGLVTINGKPPLL
ncbi:VgrG-related protein [Streptomyces millisiae]|uniref:VgrG-related protein n=1 Tax=Streptomyces millisiae TaxID=3075542 RepID=A0ABU2LWC2_9ACTN|nr:VgrG-related protein [Streptomyces sp. DSM 44918]MDT0321573.1 VgrG-related protein [Streptomyces sp. DSM 44918]